MKTQQMFLWSLLWILFALYPNPMNLAVSLYRLYDPDIDSQAVRILSANNESNPAKIEKDLEKKIPYAHDWQVYGMPWYFPTVREVLEKGRGDCKAQAILFASLLQGKRIDNHISYSFTHMWVEYRHKPETATEKADRTVVQLRYSPSPILALNEQGNGKKGNNTKEAPQVHIPIEIGGDQLATMKSGLWDAMPAAKKRELVVGLAGIGLFWLAIFIWQKK